MDCREENKVALGQNWKALTHGKKEECLINCEEKHRNLDAKHVKAHCTDKEKQSMTSEEKFVLEGNEKADELAKDGAEVDGGAMAAKA